MTRYPGRYLGIDIGGTKVALRAEDDRGDEDDRGAVRTGALATLVGDGGFDAIGVAVPAAMDPAGRVTAWPNRPGWIGLDLGGALRSLVPGAEVAWGDDGGLGAFAEAAASGSDNVLYLGV